MRVSVQLVEAPSAYAAKLNSFVSDQPSEVQNFIKSCLNAIFVGIRKDFGGYSEGKRPTIKDFGQYQTLSMTIQANNKAKSGETDNKRWRFYYPIKDYCSQFGKIIDKKINGNSYQCVVFNHNEDLEDYRSGSEYEQLTSQAAYPMVGVYCTGANGRYKNLDKNLDGNTYSVVVSVPKANSTDFNNPYMTKSGNRYVFSNDTKDSSGYQFTLTYDMSDGEFVSRKFKEGDPDTYTCVYTTGRNSMKAFKELVDTFDKDTGLGTCSEILTKHGIRIKHSWWFNPYTD